MKLNAIIGKRQIILAGLVLVLGVAVYLNWEFNKGDLLTVAHYTRHRNLEMLQVYNDQLNAEQDLPRYIEAFEGVKL